MVDLCLRKTGSYQPVGEQSLISISPDDESRKIFSTLRISGITTDNKIGAFGYSRFFPGGTSFPRKVRTIFFFTDYALQTQGGDL